MHCPSVSASRTAVLQGAVVMVYAEQLKKPMQMTRPTWLRSPMRYHSCHQVLAFLLLAIYNRPHSSGYFGNATIDGHNFQLCSALGPHSVFVIVMKTYPYQALMTGSMPHAVITWNKGMSFPTFRTFHLALSSPLSCHIRDSTFPYDRRPEDPIRSSHAT